MSDNCPQCGEPYTIHTTGGCPRMRLVEYPYVAPLGGCPICAANAPLFAKLLAALPAPEPPLKIRQAVTRLREFVRAVAPGGCQFISQGSACECPLCDIDRLADGPDLRAPVRDAWTAGYNEGQAATLARGSRVAERPAPDYKKMLEDLAEAAVGYLNAQAHVGVTEDDLRRLNYQLGCLAGPHLKAYTAGSPPQTESTEP